MVRSKSEVIIADALYDAGIPYRYEWERVFGGVRYVPDFTLLRPYDRREIIWEHFGMMDDEDYRRSTHIKLGVYMRHGYTPGDNFIATYESLENPLDPREVRFLVDRLTRIKQSPASEP